MRNKSDAKHLLKFIDEYDVKQAYIVCCTPKRYKINEKIVALPWQEIDFIFVKNTKGRIYE